MKCSICKNEFGIGETCQHCGTDKVVALGNYNGYEAPVSGAYNSNTTSASQPKMVTVDSMVCHFCGEIIPVNSKFCPYCSQNLWVKCPKCGNSYSSQYPACGECGTNRNEYIKNQQRLVAEEKRQQEEKKLIEQENIRLTCPDVISANQGFQIEWSVAYNDVECSINVANGTISHTYTKLPPAGQIGITRFKGIKKDITVTLIARNRIGEFTKQKIIKYWI